jgi:hypothetical protein
MLGTQYDDVKRRGDGCSFGCRCAACQMDARIREIDAANTEKKNRESSRSHKRNK